MADVKTNKPLLDEFSKISDAIGSSKKKREKFVENVCKAKIQFQNTKVKDRAVWKAEMAKKYFALGGSYVAYGEKFQLGAGKISSKAASVK